MVKIQVLTKCELCQGKAYLPVGEDVDYRGNRYLRHVPCMMCQGTGEARKWIELPEFLLLLEQSKCQHLHVTSQGGFHFTSGEVWDDIKDICNDCGEVLI
jgi:hypothetical protein